MGALLSSARCKDYVDFPLFLFVYRILRYNYYWMLSRFLFCYCIPILVISLYWIKKIPINWVLHESFWLAINPSLQPYLYRFSLHETIISKSYLHAFPLHETWMNKKSQEWWNLDSVIIPTWSQDVASCIFRRVNYYELYIVIQPGWMGKSWDTNWICFWMQKNVIFGVFWCFYEVAFFRPIALLAAKLWDFMGFW